MKWSFAFIAVGLAGCGSGSSLDYRYAQECTDRRTNELYSRVAVQDVADEEVQAIIEQCLSEASTAAS